MIFVLAFFICLFILYLLKNALSGQLSAFFHHITGSQKASILVLAAVFLPGTIIHELSHYLMAVLVRVHVGGMEFMPKVLEGNTIKMGSVSIAKCDPFRRLIIGSAPFLFGSALLFGMLFLATGHDILGNKGLLVILGYVVFVIGNTMFSSKRDMEGAIEMIIILAAIGVILYLFGVRLPSIDPNTLLPEWVINLFKQADIFLLVPLGIDLLLLLLLRGVQVIVSR